MKDMTGEQAYLMGLRTEDEECLTKLKKHVADLDAADEVTGFRLIVDLRQGSQDKALVTGSGGGSMCWVIDERVIGA